MAVGKCEIGIIGLGVMGRNFVLNMADHGHAVAGYDKDPEKVKALGAEAGGRRIVGAATLRDFVEALSRPRALMMLVPAGAPVDSVIEDAAPLLEPGDLIIESGNSHFRDTDRRGKALAGKGLLFLGVGISGGESGARHGPSIMPGGPRDAYERIRPIFESAAAQVEGEPCVTWLGPSSAGHYVKMVHNGIEYALMQLLSETYDLMTRGPGLSDDELHDVYDLWNRQELGSFLVEITSRIFLKTDPRTGKRLIHLIRDAASQKGTGKWTTQDALDLGVPVPAIDAAVAMRNLSARETERNDAARALPGPNRAFARDRETFLGNLRDALYASMILAYAQGLAQLGAASAAYGYGIDLERVAAIWRGGCIIRASLLEEIRAAYRARPDLPNLVLDPHLGKEVARRQQGLRNTVRAAAAFAIPAPGFMASLGYFDAYRAGRLPTNLIQAQRDFFGAHTYRRVDEEGIFHTEWETT